MSAVKPDTTCVFYSIFVTEEETNSFSLAKSACKHECIGTSYSPLCIHISCIAVEETDYFSVAILTRNINAMVSFLVPCVFTLATYILKEKTNNFSITILSWMHNCSHNMLSFACLKGDWQFQCGHFDLQVWVQLYHLLCKVCLYMQGEDGLFQCGYNLAYSIVLALIISSILFTTAPSSSTLLSRCATNASFVTVHCWLVSHH